MIIPPTIPAGSAGQLSLFSAASRPAPPPPPKAPPIAAPNSIPFRWDSDMEQPETIDKIANHIKPSPSLIRTFDLPSLTPQIGSSLSIPDLWVSPPNPHRRN